MGIRQCKNIIRVYTGMAVYFCYQIISSVLHKQIAIVLARKHVAQDVVDQVTVFTI